MNFNNHCCLVSCVQADKHQKVIKSLNKKLVQTMPCGRVTDKMHKFLSKESYKSPILEKNVSATKSCIPSILPLCVCMIVIRSRKSAF